jgi:hypothetical protein
MARWDRDREISGTKKEGLGLWCGPSGGPSLSTDRVEWLEMKCVWVMGFLGLQYNFDFFCRSNLTFFAEF